MRTLINRGFTCFAIITCTYLIGCSVTSSQYARRDFDLGEEALNKEDYDEAIRYFTVYLEENPVDADAHLKLGLAFLNRGSLRGAVNEFKQSITLDPGNEKTKSLIKNSMHAESIRLSREGKEDVSMRYLTAYLTINPDDIDTHITLAKAFMKTGNQRNAIVILNKAVSLDPKNPEVAELLDNFSDGFH